MARKEHLLPGSDRHRDSDDSDDGAIEEAQGDEVKGRRVERWCWRVAGGFKYGAVAASVVAVTGDLSSPSLSCDAAGSLSLGAE